MTLPHGFRVRVGDDVRVHDGGRTLVGGAPMRVIRLRAPAPALARGALLEARDPATTAIAERLLAANLASPVLSPVSDPGPGLTVVIPVRDRAERLGRLLEQLGSLPVVVVDDASRDPGAVAAVALRYGAELVPLSTNLGPAGARNAGLAHVRTEFVAFVDSDVVVDAATLRGLAGHFADSHVAAVAPRVRGVARNADPRRFERWDVEGLSLDLGDRPALVRPWSKVAWLPSACLLVRRSDLGGEAFEPGRRVGEDVDLVWRLIRRGRHVRYDPGYTASHDSRGTWRAWLTRKAYYGTGGAWLAQRHGDWMAPAVFSPLPLAGTAALLLQRRCSPPVALGAIAVLRWRLGSALPATPDRARLANALTIEASSSTLRQATHLLLRHWWPGVAVACLLSRRARRAVAAALVWDALDHVDVPWRRAPEAFIARRVDDLAYGAGLWMGAARARSVRVLVPRMTGLRRAPAPLDSGSGRSPGCPQRAPASEPGRPPRDGA